jgi:hypothetical protein
LSVTVAAGQGAPFSPIRFPQKISSAPPAPMSPYPAETRWTLALSALVAQPAYDGSDGYFPIQGDRVAYDLRQGTQRWMVFARPLSSRLLAAVSSS